jgi:HK97 family phage prohead protease
MNKNLEIRQFDCHELRTYHDKKGKKKVRGYAAVFNSLSEDLGGFREKINRNAFDNVLDDDVVAVFNHDMNMVLGRTTSGTLKLSVDDRGLFTEIDMPNTTLGNDLTELVERGDISKMSFGFYVDRDEWEESEQDFVREVKEVKKLIDVSLVTKPAYNETSVAVRSLDNFKQHKTELNTLNKLKIKLLNLKK